MKSLQRSVPLKVDKNSQTTRDNYGGSSRGGFLLHHQPFDSGGSG